MTILYFVLLAVNCCFGSSSKTSVKQLLIKKRIIIIIILQVGRLCTLYFDKRSYTMRFMATCHILVMIYRVPAHKCIYYSCVYDISSMTARGPNTVISRRRLKKKVFTKTRRRCRRFSHPPIYTRFEKTAPRCTCTYIAV